jgi:SAM-dependent methyltransferase
MASDPLVEVKQTWERLANLDPFWAVLSEPDKKGGRWDLQEFLETGVDEVDHVVEIAARFGLTKRDEALDFGCGVGRLSFPLATHFAKVVGVDISPTMLERARALNPSPDRISFMINESPDLAMFDDDRFDLVYSNIVLQHMDPAVAKRYVAEFMRLVPVGGFVVFQLPSHFTEEFLPNGSNGVRLPEGAHRAEIEKGAVPDTMKAGTVVPVQVSVTNRSKIAWTQDLTFVRTVGNQWLGTDGSMVLNDDGRVRLPGTVAPGQNCVVTLDVTAPAAPGRYLLDFDVVEENVTWFKEKGSPTLKVEVEVESSPTPLPVSPDYPVFKMEGVRKEEILALLDRHGGDVVHIEEHITEWYSYKYFVRKARKRRRGRNPLARLLGRIST